jgi:hypothetical protein
MNGMISAPWRKSSYSGNSGADCVEVTTWRKASYSGNNGTNCVEADVAARGSVLVRDTTNRNGTVLAVPAEAWDRFTGSLRLRQPVSGPWPEPFTSGRVLVRDTTNRDGAVLAIPAEAWDRFTASIS